MVDSPDNGGGHEEYLRPAEQRLHHHNRTSYDDQLKTQKSHGSNSLHSPHYTSRTKGVKNWVSGGHGMQAVFLDSTRKSCGGTGVFLPQSAGINFPSKKKPCQGSSLIICVQILIGYTETLHNMLTQLSGSPVSWRPYLCGLLGVFTIVTMWAVVVTEGCRKIKLQYYGLLGSSFWEHIKDILNPDTSIGAAPWVYYSIYAFFVFLFNILDIANLPKEIADYLNKMRARIPNIKPGKATIEYLTKVQA